MLSIDLISQKAVGAAAAAAEEEPPDQTLQRPRRCSPPALAGILVREQRRPCRGGPHHVLPPDFLVKPSSRKSSWDKLLLIKQKGKKSLARR
ncbi:Transcriptional Activator Gli3 [Manis pentadactyla]|nr:Transcriptional Activator Gli3 [Manis pentadactyla]